MTLYMVEMAWSKLMMRQIFLQEARKDIAWSEISNLFRFLARNVIKYKKERLIWTDYI